MIKQFKFLLLVILLSIPAFFRMVRSGIFSMSDFHLFRLYEFDKCVKAMQIPCRWAPDAGLGYGEPLFNFYPQLPYAIGEIFHLLGFTFVDSLKILFTLSIIGSAIAIYFLAKHLWKSQWAGIVSAAIYIYAPYRAVDVWVRGALPEALAFTIFPLIILAIEKRKLITLGFLLSALILTHNLSALMFLPVVLVWLIYRKYWKGFWGFIVAAGLSAFYVLPVIFESRFVDLVSTTQGYFDFRAHFLTLSQIFLDFTWGYGGSTWGEGDGLNLSVGLIQWVLPLVIVLVFVLKKEILKQKEFLILLIAGFVYLFLTHNKSTFIWENLSFTVYLQFPWRFLGVAVFCFALSSGLIVKIVKNRIFGFALLILVSYFVLRISNFFKPDIWYNVSDSYFLSGGEWDRQRSASIGDYWPNFGHKIPTASSDGRYINYFPGWNYTPNEEGLIPAEGAEFENTQIRNIGNIISLVALCVSILLSFLL